MLDALLTGGLARIAGASLDRTIVLALAMLCLQASIGSANDIADLERDRGTKPGKPLPRGLITPAVARTLEVSGLVAGLALSLLASPAALGVAVVGVGLGYAYDLRLKATPWSWLPFALGVALLPVYAWLGATGSLPWPFAVLVPMAVGGGAALALANELADDERDREAGLRTAVGVIGRERAWRLGAALSGLVAVVALLSMLALGVALAIIVVAVGAVAVLAAGLALGRSVAAPVRERAWEAQAIGIACLALAWLGGLASRGLF